MDGPFHVYKHLPVEVIETMKSPQDHTVSSLCEIMHINELSALLVWNGTIGGTEEGKLEE
jgi:hypothetical protein